MNITNQPYKRSINPLDWSLVLLAAFALSIALFFCGCATSWQDATGKSLVTVKQSVDSAMQAWTRYRVINHIGDADPKVAQVNDIKHKYDVAFKSALDAYNVAVKTGEQSIFTQASAVLTQSQTDVLNLIATFTK